MSLAPVLALAQYPFPSADDYCVAVEARKGFWRMQSTTYLEWTGRYTPTFIQGALSHWDLATIYPWFCVLTVVATLLAARAAISALAPRRLSQVELAATAVVATVVFIGRLPSPTEAFFWMTSAITYQWAIIVYLVWLALLVGIVGQERPGVGRGIAAVILTVLLPGFNEVLAPVVLLTIAGVVAVDRRRTGRSHSFLMWLLGMAVVSTVVSLAAPGNAIRSNSYPDIPSRHNLGFALIETGRQSVRFLADFASYPLLWVAAFAAWWWRGPRLDSSALRRGSRVGTAILVPVAVVYITLFPLYWEYGAVNHTGEGRTYNVTYFCFLATVVWAVGRVLDETSRRWPGLRARLQMSPALDLVMASALVALMVTAPGTVHAFRTLPLGPEYLAAQQARETILRASSNRGTALLVNAMTIRPDGLFWGGIAADENHWINGCVASYYGLTSVRTPELTTSNEK